MSVSNYLAKSEYGCRYHYDKLKDVIYLVSESHLKFINIDNGEANISGLTESPLEITGFNIEFKEETSLDERYKFQKSLTISVNGYSTFEDFDEKYYAIIVAKDNTYYMVNVDFPSKVAHTYHLSKDTNRTDFTLSSVSNFPALKLNGFNPDNATSCKNYAISGVDGLKMLESAKTELKESENKVIATEEFKLIEYLGETLSFQEAYDGDKFTTTLEFQIAFDAYKTSWHYNLLEFIMNRYAAIIGIKNSSNKIYTGFKEGLQPNYSIESSNGKDKSDIVTITLIETANKGLTIGDFEIEINSTKHWRYVSKVGNTQSYICFDNGIGMYLLQEESDYFGNPTGNYKAYSGSETWFNELTIVDSFEDIVTFYSPECFNAGYKWRADYQNGTTKIALCNNEGISEGEINLANLVTVRIGECVTVIGTQAFEDCTTLTSCTFGSNVDTIGSSAFINCSGLTSIDLPEKLEVIGNWAFEYCSGLTSVVIPNNVYALGDAAFSICTSLTDVTIGSGITNFGMSVFEYCPSLTSVTLCDGLTVIGETAFASCINLPNITIPNSVTSIGVSAFNGCRSLSSVTIPDSVTNIGERAFKYCTGLTGITVEALVPAILGSGAFDDTSDCPIFVPCESLAEYKRQWNAYESRITCSSPGPLQYRWVQAPLSEGFICDECPREMKYKLTLSDSTIASAECDSSTAITRNEIRSYSSSAVSADIGRCVQTIGERAFDGFHNLTSITIPDSVTSIGNDAFYYCDSLTDMTIPSGVTSIGNEVFQECYGLTNVTMHSGITSIGNYAFAGCYSLTNLVIPNSVTSIGQFAFNRSGLSSITIPDSVASIGNYVFDYSTGLTSCTIGSGVTSISQNAFSNCINLTNIVFSNSLTTIGSHAFEKCSGLTSVNIPSSITSIGWNAFNKCSSLTSITVNAIIPPSLSSGAFSSTPYNKVIYVPAASVDAYKTASGWSEYANIIQAI